MQQQIESLANNQDPHAIISNIRWQISAMGANDSEMNDIDKIVQQLDNKQISAEEAVKKVTAIYENKQDYH